MSARIVMRGREVWSSDRAKPHGFELMPEGKKHPVIGPPLPPAIGAAFVDPAEGTAYRVVEHLDPLQGWCLAEQLLKLYGVRYQTLMRWCQFGHLDAAMEQGSPTKRYRVRNHGTLLDLAKKEKPALRRMPRALR